MSITINIPSSPITTTVIIILTLSAFIISAGIYPLFYRVAKRHGVYDVPDNRKLQKAPVPVLGGVVVAAGIFVPLMAAVIAYGLPNLRTSLIVMAALVTIGVIDDIRNLSAVLRFCLEFVLIGFLCIYTGLAIKEFYGLFGIGTLNNYIAIPLSMVAGVGIINAINLIDGVDGYSSGYGILANTFFAIIFFSVHEQVWGLFSIICAASLLPFFLHNVFGKKSKMYIGDGGSLLIGCIMVLDVFSLLRLNSFSGTALAATGVSVVALCLAVLCIPVFDTLRVMCTRIIHKTSPFHPDKTHLHHLFIDMGFSHVGTSLTILMSNLAVTFLWWISYRLGASLELQFTIVMLLGCLTTFVYYPLMRKCQEKDNALWHFMQAIGKRTHFENNRMWQFMQKIVDYGPF